MGSKKREKVKVICQGCLEGFTGSTEEEARTKFADHPCRPHRNRKKSYGSLITIIRDFKNFKSIIWMERKD